MSNTETTIEKTEVGADVVRAWARTKGYWVGTRGHLSQELIDTFNRRHRKQFHTSKNPMVVR
jgi:hypothetical protein